jgi:hypothetical protein
MPAALRSTLTTEQTTRYSSPVGSRHARRHPPESCNTRRGDEGIARRAVVVILSVGVILAALAIFLYNTRWPPRVDDLELARIGSPTGHARPTHGPYTVSGSVICVDSCLVRGRWYPLSGQPLATVAVEIRQHLAQKGYVVQPGLRCFEYGPPVLRPGSYELVCSVDGRKGKFTATAQMQFHRSEPIVPLPRSGEYSLASPPSSNTMFEVGDGILVEVNY